MTPLAQSIALDRQAKGLTQQQLAQQLGVSQQSVSNWEDGKSLPRTKRLHELVALFGNNSRTRIVAREIFHHTGAPQPTREEHLVRPPPALPPNFSFDNASDMPLVTLTRAAAELANAAESLAHSASEIAKAVAKLTDVTEH